MTPLPHEQTRARYPDESGYAERGGVKLHYEVYGPGEPTVLLLARDKAQAHRWPRN